MTISEGLSQQGAFSLRFRPDEEGGLPKELLEQIDFHDHLVVTSPPIDLKAIPDPLPHSKYTGVILSKEFTDAAEIGGAGLIWWLGDENDIGRISESDITFSGDTLASAIAKVLTPEIVAGTIHSQAPKTMSGVTIPALTSTPRKNLDKVCEYFGCEWRITPQGYLEAGTMEQLYPTTTAPTTILLPRDKAGGDEPHLNAVPIAEASQTNDRRGYATRVVLAYSGEDGNLPIAAADVASTTYKDLHGNTMNRKKIISESTTDGGLAPTRALGHLAHAVSLRRELTISTEDFEVVGDEYGLGDTVLAFDELSDLSDSTAESIAYGGKFYNSTDIRLVGWTYPITEDHGLYIRSKTGTYIDVTKFFDFEEGSVQLNVGAFGRSLVGDPNEQLGPRIVADASVPAVPVFGVFTSTTYEDDNGIRRGAITAQWTTPANTDGTSVVDGSHYTLRWKRTGTGTYQYQDIPWNENTETIQDLPIAVSFDFSIQAQDAASPPNMSGFSAITTVVAGTDITPPSTPTGPTVAGNVLKIQVQHSLGKASGGTFNLESDLDHLNVYASTTSGFTPGTGNYLGAIDANKTHLDLLIPVIKSFPMDSAAPRFVKVTAVDKSGNESPPSGQASVTATLVTDAFIENVSADKITAGTVNVSMVLNAAEINGGIINTPVLTGGTVQTDSTGQRAVMSDDAGLVDDIHAFCAYSTEGYAGMFTALAVFGGGGTRYIPTALFAAGFTGHVAPGIEFTSRSFDGTIGATINMRTGGGSYVALTNNLDLAAQAGGRVYLDDEIDLIMDGSVQMKVDGGEAGIIGSSAFTFNVIGIGTKRLRVGVPDSGGAGKRLVFMNN